MKQLWTHTNEYQMNTLSQGYLTSGPLISEGIDDGQRTGAVVNVSGLHFRGVLNSNSSTDCFARCMVVGYPGVNGDPTLNLFRNGQGGLAVGVNAINGLDAMYWPLNKMQLHVYVDKLYKLSAVGAGNAGASTRAFSHFVKFGGKKVQFKGNLTGSGNQNWMYSIIWITAEAPDDTSSGNTVELSQLERLYFKDG